MYTIVTRFHGETHNYIVSAINAMHAWEKVQTFVLNKYGVKNPTLVEGFRR